MITLMILAIILGLALIVVITGCTILLDPIIAILVIWGIVKIIKKLTKKK